MVLGRERAARLAVFALLGISGAVGLGYEVIWTHAVAEVIGTSGEASAIVLGTFMAGLALGAYAIGRWADRAPRPLRIYGALEVGIGLCAWGFLPALDWVARIYWTLAADLPLAARPVARALLVAAVLLLPTFFMGGTLPVLVRHFTGGLPRFREHLARLYAINSLGAGMGAFLTGVIVIPAVGLSGSLYAFAGLSIAVGLVALFLGQAPVRTDQGPVELARSPEVEPRAAARRAAVVGLALGGFGSLLGEVALIRWLTLVMGSSPYVFTLILTGYVLGIGLGSYWISQRSEGPDSLRLFGMLQLGVAVAMGLALPLFVRLPFVFWKASHALNHTGETWPLYQMVTFSLSLLAVGPVAFAVGAAFPCGVRAVATHSRGLGGEVGRAYLFNTLGTVAGASVGGLWLLPAAGLEGVFAIALGAHFVAASIALLSATPSAGRLSRVPVMLPLAAVFLLLFAVQRAERGATDFVAAAGTFRLRDVPPSTFSLMHKAWREGQDVLFHQDDAGASVVVTQEKATGAKALLINGKADASSGSDLSTQVLLGQMGVLLHARDVKRALVVGLGSGVTAGSVLTHPVDRLDVLELSPAVASASRHFDSESGRPLADPRTHLQIEDARSFLRLTPERYDLIVSEPSNPWTVGASALFTREFFQSAAQRLNEGGVLVQWIHTYESSEAIVRLVMRTLRETFPHAVTWLGPQDLLLIASRQPLVPDWTNLAARMSRPSVQRDLARIGIDSPVALLALQVQSDQGQAEFAGEGVINTSDRNLLEFAAPVAFFLDAPFQVPDERLRPGPEPLLVALQRTAPWDANALRSIHQALRPLQPAQSRLLGSVARRWWELDPQSDEAAWALALSAYAAGDLGTAAQVLETRKSTTSERLAEAYLSVAAARAQRNRSVFHPAAAEPEQAFAGWAAERFPNAPSVQAALQRFQQAAPKVPGRARW